MDETQYWNYYEVVRGDLIKASYCYYESKEINEFAKKNSENFDELNSCATFWKTTMHGLQIGWFMALSRLFDQGPNTHTMARFLDHTVAHPEFFSREAFDLRRMKDAKGGSRPEWLDSYVAQIWVPATDDLRELARLLRPYRQKWSSHYNDIRDRVFAHTIAIDHADITALFSRALVADIEEILQGLGKILEIIKELWLNGRHPNQHTPSTEFLDDIVLETRQLLGSVGR
jgi:hypothetical protein